MIAWWMFQSLTIGVLIALAARGAESVMKAAGRPLRWIWAVALLLTIGLTILVPFRTHESTGLAAIQLTSANETHGSAGSVQDALPALLRAGNRAFEQVVGWTSAPARIAWRAVAPTSELSSELSSMWLGVLWSVLAGSVCLVFIVVLYRYHLTRRWWPVAVLQGIRVRVSSTVGPAVMGIARAEIIVPQWLLARNDREQWLVLEHEREHLSARDPLLLAVACASVIVLPWHPATWWMLSRLRLSVELDCDRRLLRRGISIRDYGNLLIELTGHRPGMRLAMPAFACNVSHLERRLLAMTASRPRFLAVRAATISALSMLGVLVACEANLPTAAEIKDLDAVSVEQKIGRLTLVDTTEVAYYVDGMRVSKERAREVSATEIASVEVTKSAKGEAGRVDLILRKAGIKDANAPREVAGQQIGYAEVRLDSAVAVNTVRLRSTGEPVKVRQFEGLLYIDNVPVDASALNRVNRDDIESVEVIKSPLAIQKYADPRAANGVILLSTKSKALDLVRLKQEFKKSEPEPLRRKN